MVAVPGPSVNNATIPMDNPAGGITPTIASDNTDYPIPKDRYGDPITYDSNPACLAGVMHDINKWIERTGNYKLLFEQYAVPLSNGALAIDQPDNIMFTSNSVCLMQRCTVSSTRALLRTSASRSTTSKPCLAPRGLQQQLRLGCQQHCLFLSFTCRIASPRGRGGEGRHSRTQMERRAIRVEVVSK